VELLYGEVCRAEFVEQSQTPPKFDPKQDSNLLEQGQSRGIYLEPPAKDHNFHSTSATTSAPAILGAAP